MSELFVDIYVSGISIKYIRLRLKFGPCTLRQSVFRRFASDDQNISVNQKNQHPLHEDVNLATAFTSWGLGFYGVAGLL